ncbi:hypothetical protein D9M72_641880 [compost metagenome]
MPPTKFFRQKRNKGPIEIGRIRFLKQFLWRAGRKNLAIIHCNQPVETLRFFHISRRNNDTHPRTILADIVDQLPELTTRQGINTRCRLIEDQ